MVAVTTVLGPVEAAELGITLTHEHLLNDVTRAWRRPADDDREGWEIARSPIRIEYLGRLRNDPYLSLANLRLDDVELAVAELDRFRGEGGNTVIDQTSEGIGRDPAGLRRIAELTGLHVVMGCGFYLERTQPDYVSRMSADGVAEHLERDLAVGVDGVRAGIIGEIGVSADFTASERKVLRGAARAQLRTGVPLSVHLPAWQRLGHDVLDIVEAEGVRPDAVLLCHLNPSLGDRGYQRALADRGAWLGYDMVGLEFGFPGEGQSPSDDETARSVASLVHDGYHTRLLLSGDVFVKTQLRTYGGYGYAHLLTGFVPRLSAHGVANDKALEILTTNPQRLFETAAKGTKR